MKFNLKEYRKLKEDKDSVVLHHPKGNKMIIAKKALSPKLKSAFAALPMAEGGEVPSAEEPKKEESIFDWNKLFSSAPEQPKTSENLNPDVQAKRDLYNQYVTGVFGPDAKIAQQNMSGAGSMFEGDKTPQTFNPDAWKQASEAFDQQKAATEEAKANEQKAAYERAIEENKARAEAGLPQTPVPQEPQANLASYAPDQGMRAQQVQVPQTEQPQMPQMYSPDTMQKYQQAFNQQVGGIQKEAQEQGRLGDQLANQAQEQVNQVQEIQKHAQDSYDQLNNERMAFQQDIQKNMINPNHYMENMSTAGKVGTAIGMLLSGLGSGITGKDPASDFLKEQIDRDINAQARNLGSRENLLSANLRQFGNMHDAMNMTRVMQNDIYAAKIQQAAAKSQGPIAQAKAQQALGQLNQQNAMLMQQMSFRMGTMKALQSGSSNIQPENKLRMLQMSGIISEGDKNKALDELKDAQNYATTRDNLLSAYDEIAKLQTVGNRLASPIQSKRRIDALIGANVPGLSKETAGRFTDSDSAYIKDILSKVGNDQDTIRKNRSVIENLFQQKGHFPQLSQYGIDPLQRARFNQQGQSKFNLQAPVKPR